MIRKRGLNVRLLFIGGVLSAMAGYAAGRRHQRWLSYRGHIQARLRAIKSS